MRMCIYKWNEQERHTQIASVPRFYRINIISIVPRVIIRHYFHFWIVVAIEVSHAIATNQYPLQMLYFLLQSKSCFA